MNNTLIIITYFLFSYALLNGSCQYTENKPVVTNIKTEPTPEKGNVFSDGNGRLINSDGWEIPMPDKKKSDGQRVVEGKTKELNKIKVTIFYYLPTETFFYTQHIDPAFQDRFIDGKFKLESIGQLTLNGKVFGYLVNARQTDGHEHGFTSRYYDSDGDGKFETLIGDSSSFSVPDWTLK